MPLRWTLAVCFGAPLSRDVRAFTAVREPERFWVNYAFGGASGAHSPAVTADKRALYRIRLVANNRSEVRYWRKGCISSSLLWARTATPGVFICAVTIVLHVGWSRTTAAAQINQYSPITLSIAGLIFARSSLLRMAHGALSLAESIAKISSVDKTNCPCPATSTSGAMISTGWALARRGMTTVAPVLLLIWSF